MVAVKKDAATGTFTPRHSSAGVLRNSGQPAALADGVATKFGAMLLADRPAGRSGLATKGAITRDERPSSRSELATKGAISLDERPSSQSGLATKYAISLDDRPSSRSGLAPPTTPVHTTPTDTAPTPASAVKRRDRKGRISLDDLFKKANRLSQLHKPHKANDAGWEAIERVRARDGELGLNHFKLLKMLGCGDIGTVYLSELRDTKFRFAMKVMDLGSFSSRRKQLRAETERDILSILDHPFLPTLYAHFETPQFLCLVMEFCSGGDLHSLRQRQTGRFFTDKSARFYAAEVLLALEYLHMMGVVYRDLKPENVLVRGDGHIMLSDFDLSLKVSVSPTLLTHSSSVSSATSSSCDSTRGRDEASDAAAFSNATSCLPRTISRRASLTRPAVDVSDLKFAAKPPSSKWKPRLSKSSSKSTRNPTNEQVVPLPELVAEPTGVRSMSFVGTHEYLAPEIIAGDGHGSAVDWWTFGIFLFELLYGKTPFKGADNDVTLVNVLAQPLEFPEKGDSYHQEVGSSAKDLIKALLVKDPQKRLGFNRGATEVKQHPFFEGINWALIRCTLPPQIPRSHSLQSQLRTQKQQDDGLLPPSKLTILPVSAVDQQSKFYDMNEDAKEPSVHFEYF